MSYCVNCGVELDKTCSQCPLCQTKVYNPNQPVDTTSPTPYPLHKGTEEPIQRNDFTILFTIILMTISSVCSLLNHYSFTKSQWSLYVVGACIVIWFFMLPIFFPRETNPFVNFTLDGLIVIIYFFVISQLHPGNGWFPHIALPVVCLVTVSLQIFYLFAFKRKSSIITKTFVLITCIGVFCGTLELLLDFHFQKPIVLSWGAIILTCCASVDILLITIASLKDVRNELRKRMHF